MASNYGYVDDEEDNEDDFEVTSRGDNTGIVGTKAEEAYNRIWTPPNENGTYEDLYGENLDESEEEEENEDTSMCGDVATALHNGKTNEVLDSCGETFYGDTHDAEDGKQDKGEVEERDEEVGTSDAHSEVYDEDEDDNKKTHGDNNRVGLKRKNDRSTEVSLDVDDGVRLVSSSVTSASRDWIGDWQRVSNLPERSEERSVQMAKLLVEFRTTAEKCVKIIVSEKHLLPEKRRFLCRDAGGIAGGDKYRCEGLFIKFVTDDRGIYGGHEWAGKAAAHELKGARAYSNLQTRLSAPLLCIVDFLGWRLCATSVLPIGHPGSLVYGSADQGKTIHKDEEKTNQLMGDCARKLNIARHLVSATDCLDACCDIEVHRGTDDNLYVVDTARALPPEDPRFVANVVILQSDPLLPLVTVGLERSQCKYPRNPVMECHRYRKWIAKDKPASVLRGVTLKHLGIGDPILLYDASHDESVPVNGSAMDLVRRSRGSNADAGINSPHCIRGLVLLILPMGRAFLYNLLRSSFVRRNPEPLSPDGFCALGRFEYKNHNRRLQTASARLLYEAIPELARKLIEREIHFTNTGELMKLIQNRFGINARHIGAIRSAVADMKGTSYSSKDNSPSRILLTEMVSRTMKSMLRHELRSVKSDDAAKVAARFFNKVLFDDTSYDDENDSSTNSALHQLLRETKDISYNYFWDVEVRIAMCLRYSCSKKTVSESAKKGRDRTYDVDVAGGINLFKILKIDNGLLSESERTIMKPFKWNVILPTLFHSLQLHTNVFLSSKARGRIENAFGIWGMIEKGTKHLSASDFDLNVASCDFAIEPQQCLSAVISDLSVANNDDRSSCERDGDDKKKNGEDTTLLLLKRSLESFERQRRWFVDTFTDFHWISVAARMYHVHLLLTASDRDDVPLTAKNEFAKRARDESLALCDVCCDRALFCSGEVAISVLFELGRAYQRLEEFDLAIDAFARVKGKITRQFGAGSRSIGAASWEEVTAGHTHTVHLGHPFVCVVYEHILECLIARNLAMEKDDADADKGLARYLIGELQSTDLSQDFYSEVCAFPAHDASLMRQVFGKDVPLVAQVLFVKENRLRGTSMNHRSDGDGRGKSTALSDDECPEKHAAHSTYWSSPEDLSEVVSWFKGRFWESKVRSDGRADADVASHWIRNVERLSRLAEVGLKKSIEGNERTRTSDGLMYFHIVPPSSARNLAESTTDKRRRDKVLLPMRHLRDPSIGGWVGPHAIDSACCRNMIALFICANRRKNLEDTFPQNVVFRIALFGRTFRWAFSGSSKDAVVKMLCRTTTHLAGKAPMTNESVTLMAPQSPRSFFLDPQSIDSFVVVKAMSACRPFADTSASILAKTLERSMESVEEVVSYETVKEAHTVEGVAYPICIKINVKSRGKDWEMTASRWYAMCRKSTFSGVPSMCDMPLREITVRVTTNNSYRSETTTDLRLAKFHETIRVSAKDFQFPCPGAHESAYDCVVYEGEMCTRSLSQTTSLRLKRWASFRMPGRTLKQEFVNDTATHRSIIAMRAYLVEHPSDVHELVETFLRRKPRRPSQTLNEKNEKIAKIIELTEALCGTKLLDANKAVYKQTYAKMSLIQITQCVDSMSKQVDDKRKREETRARLISGGAGATRHKIIADAVALSREKNALLKIGIDADQMAEYARQSFSKLSILELREKIYDIREEIGRLRKKGVS